MCAWAWSDSFDPYAAVGDATLGYWDSGAAGFTLQTGRFAGSQCVRSTASANIWFTKASTANDSVHHISFATQQTSALSGSNLMHYFQLLDGTTGQCAVVFRIDGAILLTSGTPAGTVLATYTGAISAQSTWTQFEIEVVVHNSTGGMRVRKNGSSTNDYDSFVSVGNLDTAGGTVNNYANKLTVGSQTTAVSTAIYLDDLIWRSDASSVPWIGDVRIVARAPSTDVQAQFSRSAPSVSQTNTGGVNSGAGPANNTMLLVPYTITYSGTIAQAVAVTNSGASGNMKAAIYADNAGVPGVVLASAGPITTVAAGNNIFTISPPLAVTVGQKIWLAVLNDTTGGTWARVNGTTNGATASATYATFPQPNPIVTTGSQSLISSITYTLNANWPLVAEAQQDAATSYVYSSNPGDADFYGLAPLSITPAQVFGVTTRAFVQKSDAGARSGAVQIKSGGTAYPSTSTALSSSWGWLWRTDVTDPNTGSAWTPTGVSNAQVGPTVVS